MANKFAIEITAADRATAVLDRVNKKVGDVSRSFGKTAGPKYPHAGGFAKVGRGLADVGAMAGGTAAKIASVSAPVSELMGAGTVAGLVAMTARWAQAGDALTRTAQITGQSTAALQSLALAARITGIDADTMTSGLRTLGSTMQDSVTGRNQEAQTIFSALGVTLRRTATGAMDAADMFRQLGNAVANAPNPQAAERLIAALGIPPELIPLLRKGADGVRAVEERARDLGAVMGPAAVERASQFALALDRLGVAAEGAGRRFADKFLPALTDAANRWAQLLGHPSLGTAWEVARHARPDLHLDPSNSLRSRMGVAEISQPMPPPAATSTTSATAADAHLDHQRLTLADRNHNPGNLRSWGDSPVVGGYAQFPDQEAGLSAAVANLMAKRQHRLDTINKIIGDPAFGWAPAADGNNVPAYVRTVSSASGIGPDQPVDLGDRETLASIMRGIVKQEGGNRVSDDQIYAAVDARLGSQQATPAAAAHVDVTIHNAPPGTTATASAHSGSVGSPRVNYAMPTSIMP